MRSVSLLSAIAEGAWDACVADGIAVARIDDDGTGDR
jgi:hypothetical protein